LRACHCLTGLVLAAATNIHGAALLLGILLALLTVPARPAEPAEEVPG
jgi:hypothetical protein